MLCRSCKERMDTCDCFRDRFNDKRLARWFGLRNLERFRSLDFSFFSIIRCRRTRRTRAICATASATTRRASCRSAYFRWTAALRSSRTASAVRCATTATRPAWRCPARRWRPQRHPVACSTARSTPTAPWSSPRIRASTATACTATSSAPCRTAPIRSACSPTTACRCPRRPTSVVPSTSAVPSRWRPPSPIPPPSFLSQTYPKSTPSRPTLLLLKKKMSTRAPPKVR